MKRNNGVFIIPLLLLLRRLERGFSRATSLECTRQLSESKFLLISRARKLPEVKCRVKSRKPEIKILERTEEPNEKALAYTCALFCSLYKTGSNLPCSCEWKQETACCLSDDLLNVITKPGLEPVVEKPVWLLVNTCNQELIQLLLLTVSLHFEEFLVNTIT